MRVSAITESLGAALGKETDDNNDHCSFLPTVPSISFVPDNNLINHYGWRLRTVGHEAWPVCSILSLPLQFLQAAKMLDIADTLRTATSAAGVI